MNVTQSTSASTVRTTSSSLTLRTVAAINLLATEPRHPQLLALTANVCRHQPEQVDLVLLNRQCICSWSHPPSTLAISIESVLSDVSDYRTAASATPSRMTTTSGGTLRNPTPTQAHRIRIPKDEFGLTEMLAIIDTKTALSREPSPPTDVVDKLYFGRKLDLEKPHPDIRDVCSLFNILLLR